MKLTTESITKEASLWAQNGFILPCYDRQAMRAQTAAAPEWVHFGAGNIFRGYIACLADELIKNGDMKSGIIAAESFDGEIIEKIYKPFDDLALLVGLRSAGERYLRVIGSIAESVDASNEDMNRLRKIAASAELKMVSFTITEKGYACTDMNGKVLASVESDIANGPRGELSTAFAKAAAMLYERFCAGAYPLALVSMDNCSANGEKLRNAVLFIVNGWLENGAVAKEFADYAESEKVSFPWTMIDKITPRPDSAVYDELTAMGIEDMQSVQTQKNTFIAPFVNAEMPQYLVIEDDFPNGRPPLEKAGVYLTDRETVNKAERMKVMTCLNPLHTALAVFGCLLGYKKIADEMNDSDLRELVTRLGYEEGLPVVTDPAIIKPEDFLSEVLTERLPNTFLPDTPQRIATDTSQKLSVRFGETIKEYKKSDSTNKLVLVPMVIAGWLRYLTGIDDNGETMPLSPDPLLDELTKKIKKEWFANAKAYADEIRTTLYDALSNRELFGTDIVKAGLAEKVCAYFKNMLGGSGAVRSTLKNALEKAAENGKEYISPYCEVSYDEHTNCAFVKWKKFCCGEDYRAPLREAIRIMSQHEECHYIADTRSGFEDTEEDTKWVFEVFATEAHKVGCGYIIFIIDAQNSLKEELEGQATEFKKYFEVKAFYSMDEAAEFLESVRE